MITSLSAGKQKAKKTYVDAVVAKVAPVTLPPERENDYLQLFFARKNSTFVKRSDYQQLGEFLLAAGVGINRCFHLMLNLLEKGDLLDDLEPQEVVEFIKRAASEVKASTEVAGNTRDRRKKIQEFNMFLHDNSAYIVEDSQRYPGGKDFIIRGSRGSGSHSTVPNWQIVYPASKLTSNVGNDGEDMSPQEYENLKLERYSTDLSLRIVKAGKEIQEFLIGNVGDGAGLANAAEERVDITFDFQQIEDILKRNLNLNFDLGFFAEFKNLMKNKANFNQNFQLLVQRQPVPAVINRKKRLIQLQNRAKRDGIEALTPNQREVVEKGENFDNIPVERIMCHAMFSVSLVVNLQEDFCRYITQTEKGPVSTYSLVSWFNPWSRYYMRASNQSSTGGEQLGLGSLPRYIVSAKNSKEMDKHRKELGYYVDEGRSDEAGITISPRGSLMYVPNNSDIDLNVSMEFEKTMSDYLDQAFKLGVGQGVSIAKDNEYLYQDREDEADQLTAKMKDVERYGGALLTCNWDYNTIQHVSKDGRRITTQDLTGSTKPTDIAIAEYLGMDMARDGERPIKTDFGQALAHLLDGIGESNPMYIPANLYRYGTDTRSELPERYGILTFRTFRSLFQAIVYGITRKSLPSLSEVIKEAKDQLDLVTTNSNEYEAKIYDDVIDENFNLKMPTTTPDQINMVLMELMSAAMNDAEGGLGSNLYRIVSEEHGQNADVEIKSHPRYFRRTGSDLKDFGNVYNYFGGLVFKLYCEALIKLKPSDLSATRTVAKDGTPVDDAVIDYKLPGFNVLSTEVLPMAAMFAKYVPEAMDYIERAEDAMDAMQPDSSIDADDIKMAGIAEGAMLFPHQLDSHRTLRRRPKFAILDVSPGGGKTITLLIDIGCVIQEDPEPVKALVICPSKLVGNWCEDMTKVSNGNWNVFPLDTAVVNRWAARDEGIDGLVELMQNAPPNTIFVAGIDFIKSKPFSVSFGARAVNAYGGVEILKRVGFNYIAFDESHKAKNGHSGTHRSIKALTTMGNVKYVRLATGTFVPKEIHDVVGQTALLTSSIFKTRTYFGNEFAKDDGDRETSGSFAPDAPFRVRSKLQRNVAVIAKKRKEWAFMLPSPQDFLIEVDMENMRDNPGSVIHRQVYLALLHALDEEVKKTVKKSKGGEGEDDDEPDEVDDDSAFGGDLAGIDEDKLQYYMQRLEQLVTDPWGDEACKEALDNAGFSRSNFVPEKIKAITDRIRGHFGSFDNGQEDANGSIRKWTPGIVVRELDLVEFEGNLFLARKESEGIERNTLPPSTKPPTADSARWKSEARGKLIVFTRYKRSCKAVFEALPPEYKSMAVAYHGDEPNREKNLDAFKNDPNVKIIVANEQSITEGHNLQMASRIIRVDTPWTPGDYEQSTARIFRPDPSAAKLDENGNPGEMAREVIFVDWIMTSNSSEVVKVARLLSRSVDVVKYEEAENPHYEELHNYNLPLVSMGWSELVQGGTVSQYSEHFFVKRILNDLQKAEFHDMRTKTVAAMIPLEATPVREDFKTMPVVPIAANQKIADREGHGYERFLDYLAHDKFDVPMTRKDLELALVGLPVRTERGFGIVKGFSSVNYRDDKETDSGGNRLLDPDQPLTSSLKVVYPGDTEAYIEPVNTCHVATEISDDIYDKIYRGAEKRKPKKSDKTRAEDRKTERKDEEKSKRSTSTKTKRKKTVKSNVERGSRTVEKRKKRRENVRSGKRVNSGVDVIKADQTTKRQKSGVTIATPDNTKTDGKDMRLRIIPSMYDGYVAIHANFRDPDAESLEKFGFNHFDSYLYIEAKRYDPYWNIIEWLEGQLKRQRMTFDRNTEKRLEAIQDSYDEKDRLNYNVVLAAKTASTLPTFFRTRHRDLKDKTKAKAYPMILPDRVRICFDLKTNPKLSKWSGRKIPGVPGKGWQIHEGMNIFLATSKTDAKKKLKELQSAGYTITNIDKAVAAIDDMKLTRSITKARGE